MEIYLKQSYSQLMRFCEFSTIFFPKELRESATLKSSSVLITHGRKKKSLALSKSTCAKELTMANAQQLTNTLFFFLFIFHFVKNNPTLILSTVNLMET